MHNTFPSFPDFIRVSAVALGIRTQVKPVTAPRRPNTMSTAAADARTARRPQ